MEAASWKGGKILLILTRKIGESLLIGDDIRIVVLEVRGKQVRLGIDAPAEIVVLREEVFQRLAQENLAAGAYTYQDLQAAARLLAAAAPHQANLRESPPAAGGIQVATRDLGSLLVREDQIVTFTSGLPGLGQIHRFALIEAPQIFPCLLLQSLDDPEVALATAAALDLVPNYQPGAVGPALREIKARGLEDVKVLVLLTIPLGRPEEMTANLMSPILINPTHGLGKQIVMENGRYPQKHPIAPVNSNPRWASAH